MKKIFLMFAAMTMAFTLITGCSKDDNKKADCPLLGSLWELHKEGEECTEACYFESYEIADNGTIKMDIYYYERDESNDSWKFSYKYDYPQFYWYTNGKFLVDGKVYDGLNRVSNDEYWYIGNFNGGNFPYGGGEKKNTFIRVSSDKYQKPNN